VYLTISEREIKLAVDSSAGPGLYEYLRRQETLGGLRVIDEKDLRLDDAYFDTADLLLWRNGGYLRIRREPRRALVTLRASRGSPLASETVESTRPLGELPEVIGELNRQFPSIGPLPEHGSSLGPLLAEAGLLHVVSLRNDREVLSVRPQTPGPRFRVKLDKVTYDTWTEPLYEIELDVCDRDGVTWAAKVVDSVRSLVPGTVRVTTATKLDRGLVLRELFQVGHGDGTLDIGAANVEL